MTIPTFGKLLRQHRKVYGLTQKELAEAIGYDHSLVSRVENERHCPPPDFVEKAVTVLDLSSDAAQYFRSAYDTTRSSPQHTTPTNLHAPRIVLIGREEERAALREQLTRVAWLTLTGPGGSGKTLLALTVAHDVLSQFPDGVFLVRLESISDPHQVIAEIAKTLQLQPATGQSIGDALCAYLRERHMLLVLDNIEQVVAVSPLLVDIVRAAPRLTLLVTSRVALRVTLEHTFAVQALPLPDLAHLPDLTKLAHNPAVALFAARAQAASHTFALTEQVARPVAELCIRLDGLPLAIELAAARSPLLTPAEMLQRLDSDLLSRGARDLAPRQQTFRDALDWSYHLLDNSEQQVFVQLGVFVGGFTIAAAEAVCVVPADNTASVLSRLDTLREQHLLVAQADVGNETRLTMLETIRTYARECLSARSDAAVVQQRHAEHYLQLAEQRDILTADTLMGDELVRIEREASNLRAALVWAFAQDNPEMALRLSSALCLFWHTYHGQSEGRHWLAQALSRCNGAEPDLRARVLYAVGYLASDQGDYADAITYLQQSLDIWQTLDHTRGAARTLLRIGYAYQNKGDNVLAEVAYLRSLELWHTADLSRDPGLPHVLACLGRLALERSDFVQADHFLQASQQHYQQQKNLHGVALVLSHLGMSALYQQDFTRACEQSEQSLILLSHLGLSSAFPLSLLGLARLFRGDTTAAREPLREALLLRDQQQDNGNMPYCLEGLAGVALAEGNPARATVLFGAADALRAAAQAPLPPPGQTLYGHYLQATRDHLPTATFDAAWLLGQTMPLTEVIEYALDDDVLVLPTINTKINQGVPRRSFDP
jgi:predicted ATPase/DNA-binding XRE family transcriptional regulator